MSRVSVSVGRLWVRASSCVSLLVPASSRALCARVPLRSPIFVVPPGRIYAADPPET